MQIKNVKYFIILKHYKALNVLIKTYLKQKKIEISGKV